MGEGHGCKVLEWNLKMTDVLSLTSDNRYFSQGLILASIDQRKKKSQSSSRRGEMSCCFLLCSKLLMAHGLSERSVIKDHSAYSDIRS